MPDVFFLLLGVVATDSGPVSGPPVGNAWVREVPKLAWYRGVYSRGVWLVMSPFGCEGSRRIRRKDWLGLARQSGARTQSARLQVCARIATSPLSGPKCIPVGATWRRLPSYGWLG